MSIGFSTGPIAPANVRLGLDKLAGKSAAAVELSAIRDTELRPLIDSIESFDLSQYSYISVHAPSAFKTVSEHEVVELLRPVFDRQWCVVVHPDVIEDFSPWSSYKDLVCIENMDKRKRTGRTADELQNIFAKLPEASLCFDIAHAYQVDPTMLEANRILIQHGHRLRQVHLSDVNSDSKHERLNMIAELAFSRIIHRIPKDIPIILETPVKVGEIDDELSKAERLFAPHRVPQN